MSETQAEKTARIDQTVRTLAQDQTNLWDEMKLIKSRLDVQEDWKLTSEGGWAAILKLGTFALSALTFLIMLAREFHLLAQVAATTGK